MLCLRGILGDLISQDKSVLERNAEVCLMLYGWIDVHIINKHYATLKHHITQYLQLTVLVTVPI